MAYRKLKDGDLVRITYKGKYHGRDGVVIAANEGFSRVQVNTGRAGTPKSECVNIPNKYILVRNDVNNFIVDGRVDIAAQDKYNEQVQNEQLKIQRESYNELEEACGWCSCCDWHNATNRYN